MRKLRIWAIVAGLLALVLVGWLFVGGSTPVISLAAEEVFSVGPVSVTNSMITQWLVFAAIIALAWLAGRNASLVPRGFTNLVEAGLEALLSLVEGVAGRENGRRFFPVVATIFIFVLFANWSELLPAVNTVGKAEDVGHGAVMEEASLAGVDLAYVPLKPEEVEAPEGAEAEGEAEGHGEAAHGEEGGFVGHVVPFLRPPSTDLNTPAAIAVVAIAFVQFWGISALGLGAYGSKFFNFRNLFRGRIVDGFIDAFVGLLELISEFARIISFTFRLFGNIFAGEVLLLVMSFLAPFVLVGPFYVLELFVGVVQAFIFAMLTLVFGVMAVAHHGGGGHGEEGEHGHLSEEHA